MLPHRIQLTLQHRTEGKSMDRITLLMSFLAITLLFFLVMCTFCMIFYPKYQFFDHAISDLGAVYLKDSTTKNPVAFLFQTTLIIMSCIAVLFAVLFLKQKYIIEGLICCCLVVATILVALPTDIYHTQHRIGAIILFFSLWILLGEMLIIDRKIALLIIMSIMNFIYMLFSFHVLEGKNPVWQKLSFMTMGAVVIIASFVNYSIKK